MALVLADRVKETTTLTGTSPTVTLLGAALGYRSFASVMTSGSTTYYCISNPNIDEWEVGIGTLSGVNTLTRAAIPLSSSSSGAAVNFSVGVKEVFVSYPASKAVIKNALGVVDPITLASPTLTGTVKIDYGTAAAPALAFSSAPTTGIYGSATYVGLSQGGSPLLKGNVTSGTNYLNINSASTGVTLAATNDGASTVDAPLTLSAKNNGRISIDRGANDSSISIGASPLNPNTLTGLGTIVMGSGVTQAAGTVGYSVLIGTGHQESSDSTSNYCIGANINAALGAQGCIGMGTGTLGVSTPNSSGCIGIGSGWTADGQYSIAVGVATALNSSIALSGYATGFQCFAVSGGSAAGDVSMAFGGGAYTTSVGQIVFATDLFVVGNQRGLYVLSASSSAGTSPALLTNGFSAAAYSIQVLGTGQVVAFKGQIVVKDMGASSGFALFDISGIATSTTLGVITLQASSVVIGLHNGTYATATAGNVVLAVAVGGISITVHGLAGTGASNWCGTFDTTEMVG